MVSASIPGQNEAHAQVDDGARGPSLIGHATRTLIPSGSVPVLGSGARLRTDVLVAVFKILDLLLNLVFRDAVGFLDLASQLIALAGNHIEVIVGELAPLGFYLATVLLPISCNDVPIHIKLLLCETRLAGLPVKHPLFHLTFRYLFISRSNRLRGGRVATGRANVMELEMQVKGCL